MSSILYKTDTSPPSRAVMMVADVLGVELEKRDLNPVLREQDTPEFTKKNPMRTVPILDEGDYSLADSHAIITYLMMKHGKPQHSPLYPADIKKRATINQILFFDCGVLFPRLRAVMAPTFFGRLGEVSRNMKRNIEDAYSTLEEYLSQTKFLADDVMTIADISVLATLSTLDGIVPIDNRYPKLKKWLAVMSQMDFHIKINKPGNDQLVILLKELMKNYQREQISKL